MKRPVRIRPIVAACVFAMVGILLVGSGAFAAGNHIHRGVAQAKHERGHAAHARAVSSTHHRYARRTRRRAVAHSSAACAAGQLSLQPGQSFEGAQSSLSMWVIQNTGSTACTLSGTPTITYTRPDGSTVPGYVLQPSASAPPAVSVAPGDQASFYVQLSGCTYDPSTGDLPTTTTMVLPGDQQPFTDVSKFSAPCDQQQEIVSPIVSGVQAPAGYGNVAPSAPLPPPPPPPPPPPLLSVG
jgi:hypothetical protein